MPTSFPFFAPFSLILPTLAKSKRPSSNKQTIIQLYATILHEIANADILAYYSGSTLEATSSSHPPTHPGNC